MKSDHIKRMITLTGDNIKRLSLYYYFQFEDSPFMTSRPWGGGRRILRTMQTVLEDFQCLILQTSPIM